MNDFPIHSLPSYTSSAKSDALFHYTTATSLYGILESQTLWGTAYYCANDEKELSAGRGVLTGLFREEMYRLLREGDPRIAIFLRRGVEPLKYAENYEEFLVSLTLSSFCTYITCFCKPSAEEDFHHGLLSQWRGYGADGGYALQLNRSKLLAAIDGLAEASDAKYELKDTHYSSENDLRNAVVGHKEAFLRSFNNYLNEISGPISPSMTWSNPLPNLLHGPLERLFDYLVHTKNQHFSEERECRLSLTQSITSKVSSRPVRYFSRNGLLVPYITTPSERFDVLGCCEWIVIGPGPRIHSRFKSVTQLVRQLGRDISVRVSHIPYTRL